LIKKMPDGLTVRHFSFSNKYFDLSTMY